MNGLKIVWGKVNLKNYNTDTQTLSLFTAVSFTQKPTVIITIDTSGFTDNSSHFMQVHNVSTTGFQIRRPDTSNTWELNYIAIGY